MDQKLAEFFALSAKWEGIRENIENQCRIHAKIRELDQLIEQHSITPSMIIKPNETFEGFLDRGISTILNRIDTEQEIKSGHIRVITVEATPT